MIPVPISNYIDVTNQLCSEMVAASADSDSQCRISKLGNRLQALAKESPDDETWRALSNACNYHTNGSGPLAHGPYAPMFVFPEGEHHVSVFPTPLDRVEPDILDVWVECANDDTLHPMPRARLADLLWVRKHGNRGKWINVAVDAYTTCAAIPEVHIVERGNMLARAVAICEESNNQDPDRKDAALTALADLARTVIDSDSDSFGVAARALDALIDAGYRCEDIVTDAMRKYDADPYRASDLRVIAMKAAPDKADEARLQAERVEAFEDAADQVDGLMRVTLLENARSVASSAGDNETVDRLNGLIQNTDTEGEMEQLEMSVSIDEETMQRIVEPITGDDTLSDALDRFARQVMPDVSDETMKQDLRDLADAHPLQTLMSRMRIGRDGSVVSLPSGSDERIAADIGDLRKQKIVFEVGFVGHAVLRDLERRYGMTGPGLVDCFSSVIPQASVDKIVVAHRHFKDDEDHSAVAVLWPAIEQIMRHVCLAHDLPTASRETTSFPQTRSLGPMLEDLAEHLDNRTVAYLRAVLIDGWSLNLRNNYAHGHPADMDDSTAYVMLFHVVCVLRLILRTQGKSTST